MVEVPTAGIRSGAQVQQEVDKAVGNCLSRICLRFLGGGGWSRFAGESWRIEQSGEMERLGPQPEGLLVTSPALLCGCRNRVGGKLASINSFGVLPGEREGRRQGPERDEKCTGVCQS